MKSVFLTILILSITHKSQQGKPKRQDLDSSGWLGSHFASNVNHYSSFPGDGLNYNPPTISLQSQSTQYSPQFVQGYSHQSVPIVSNDLDKPIDEPQEYVPPQSMGVAQIPQLPPPGVPVNAVASNVPAQTGAVFLGSGSLGVVQLGNGAFALGSGSLGYSNMRQNPRPSLKSPLYPPVDAAPNLIPAAIPSIVPAPTNVLPAFEHPPPPVDYNNPLLNLQHKPQLDPNGYEFLAPNRVGFGSPPARLPRIKTTQAFATPTALLVQPQPPPSHSGYLHQQLVNSQSSFGPQQSSLLDFSISSQPIDFGQKISNSLYSQSTVFGR